jgi:catechol 2,3-dioxygenase-like lactoylglutathione lyase family enzyme
MTITSSNTTIMVKSMDNAVAFYQSIGFAVKQRWGNFYAQLTAPGTTLGLHPANANSTDTSTGNFSIGLVADDFEGAKKLLEDLAIPFSAREEEGGSFLHFTDPDGYALYFIKSRW